MRSAVLFLALLATSPAFGQGAFPFSLGGPFELRDQHGATRTEADPDGYHQLLFFGYANCEQICSASLPLMADIVDDLANTAPIRPVMITVDPKRDTIDAIGAPLEAIHPTFVGLTGSEESLHIAYDAFSVEKELLFVDPAGGEVFAHGSFIYLLDGEGQVLTLVPPIADVDEAVRIISPYILASN